MPMTPSSSPHSYAAYGLRIRSDVQLPGLRAVAVDSLVDVEIRNEAIADAPTPQSGDWHRLAANRSAFVKAGVGVVEVRDGRRIAMQPLPGAERELAHYVLGLGMALLLQQRGLYCLHASCVRAGDGAVAFAGDSGAGKSTLAHAMHAAGHALVTDDIAAIDDAGAVPMVQPGHVAIRLAPQDLARHGVDPAALDALHPGTDKRSYPLAAAACAEAALPLARVYLLLDGDGAAVEEITGLPAALALLRYCFAPELLSGVAGSSALMQRCVGIAKHTRVFRLFRRRDLDALPALTEMLARSW